MVIGVVRRRALAAANQAYAAASDGRDLVADLQDGFGADLELELDENAVSKLMGLMRGEPGTLPIKAKIRIDPTIDT